MLVVFRCWGSGRGDKSEEWRGKVARDRLSLIILPVSQSGPFAGRSCPSL
jgi:hypothetical protein